MEEFFQQLTNGLAVGGIYALIALGYTMVYGVLKLINFAHGDLFTYGAYLCLTLLTSLALTCLLYTSLAMAGQSSAAARISSTNAAIWLASSVR